jgi:Ca2+-binding EF-hand superfamily protein
MKLFKNVDKNNDRLLDLKEFIELVNNFSNDLDQSDKKAMFNFLDVDGDEKVSSVEFFGRIYPTFYEEGPGKDKSFIPEKYEYALKFIQDIN